MVRRSLLHSLVACVFAFSSLTISSAFADEELEYQVKTAYIGRVIKFVTWPQDKKSSKTEICVLGENPIINSLKKLSAYYDITMVKGANLNGANSHCNALFIGAAEGEEYAGALTAFKNKPILTIGDAPDFIDNGGMIGLSIQGSKVKLTINKNAVSKAALNVDPQLLELAAKVVDD
jgi:hypothetical protein